MKTFKGLKRQVLACCLVIGLGVITFLWDLNTLHAAPTQPERPRVYIDTTMPDMTDYTVVNVGAGGDLQAALDSAACGTIITLQADATYTGNFRLRNRGDCNGKWIVLQSSAMENLPAQGTRVKPSDSGSMPKIMTPGYSPAIEAEFGANYYWLKGIEVSSSDATNTYMSGLISIAYTLPDPTLAHHIVFDRCYVHGSQDSNINCGIGIDFAAYVAVVDSYVSDIHTSTMESQAIAACTGPGPYKFVNNYIEGAGENLFIGGCGEEYAGGFIESDIEIRGNHIYKPLSWMPTSPDYGGRKWCVKNSFEIKSGQRVLFDGNIIENFWISGQLWAVALTPRTVSWKSHLKVVNDITITNNIFRHIANGINILGKDDGDQSLTGTPTIQANRFLIRNNIFDDVGGSRWGESWGSLYAITGVKDVTVDHNTALQSPLLGAAMWVGWTHDHIKADGLTITNNLHNHNRGGLAGDGVGSGRVALDAYATDYNVEKNVFVLTLNKNTNPDYYSWDTSYFTGLYPPDNYFPMTLEEVNLTNFNEGDGGDYALLPSSPYKNAGTDGKDIGADVAAVNYATRGAVSGIWDRAVGLSPESQSFGASGGTGAVYVTSLTQGSWSVRSDVDWVTITSGATGSGNGQVNYSVGANGAAALRSGTLTIGGETFVVNQAGVDSVRPSAPTGLQGTVMSSSQINLSWNGSTDNVAVTGYRIYRNGKQIGTATGTTYADTGLRPKTTYRYQVAAYDGSDNVSAKSKAVSRATQPVPSTKFTIGDRVHATGKIIVRSEPSNSEAAAGAQAKGAIGTVVGGPSFADRTWWWQIDFATDADGWVIETKVKK